MTDQPGDVDEFLRLLPTFKESLAGNGRAMRELGMAALGSDDTEMARQWFELAVAAGDSRSSLLLARLAPRAGDIEAARSSAEEAAERLRKRLKVRADAGDSDAMFSLYRLEISEHNLEAAAAWLAKAVDAGNPRAVEERDAWTSAVRAELRRSSAG